MAKKVHQVQELRNLLKVYLCILTSVISAIFS